MLDTLIRQAEVYDGSGGPPYRADVGLAGGRIERIERAQHQATRAAAHVVEARGLALAPGFIDVHSHDDVAVIGCPQLPAKLSQGVTTVIVGNCGISAAPVRLLAAPPDPMNLLGAADAFEFPSFASYVAAVEAAQPAVNVAALVGHTSLRQNHLDRLDRAATRQEVELMRTELADALAHGALGLSTGLAYASAAHAPTAEVSALAEVLAPFGGIYCTHLRSESGEILAALAEAFGVGRHSRSPVAVSHLKCAGIENQGRSAEVLAFLDAAGEQQSIGCDCYPYTASSSTLDLGQVRPESDILITWSEPHPELGGWRLAEIAQRWQVELLEAARRLQPAGAVYHCMAETDVERILSHPATVIGSDGLPSDPRPHPRLWGAFARVLGHYVRERKLFTLSAALHKMTAQPAARYGLRDRGLVREGAFADLVLFDPAAICDAATFTHPTEPARGIAAVWVNGALSWQVRSATGARAGRFLRRAGLGTQEQS